MTTESKPKNFPRVPDNLASIVKPEELVDIVEMSPLTLNDRRIFNILLGHAWNDMMEQDKHKISRKALAGYVDSNNQDIAASLRRLMSAIVQIRIPKNQNGKESIRQIALLGSNEIELQGTTIFYSFPPELKKIVANTKVFARIHTDVMFQLSSKYSLALYEFLQRRKNLQHINHEILSIDEVRGWFGIAPNKLKMFGHLNDKAIKPAVKEVSFLSEFEITAEPVKEGRGITHVKFTWTKKTDIGKQIAAVEELERHKAGRKARMDDAVESIVDAEKERKLDEFSSLKGFNSIGHFAKAFVTGKPVIRIPSSALEEAKKMCIWACTGWDIYAIEQEFIAYTEKKGEPIHNVGKAFVGFVAGKIKKPPR
jgi:plasmid replication initiation protein